MKTPSTNYNSSHERIAAQPEHQTFSLPTGAQGQTTFSFGGPHIIPAKRQIWEEKNVPKLAAL